MKLELKICVFSVAPNEERVLYIASAVVAEEVGAVCLHQMAGRPTWRPQQQTSQQNTRGREEEVNDGGRDLGPGGCRDRWNRGEKSCNLLQSEAAG